MLSQVVKTSCIHQFSSKNVMSLNKKRNLDMIKLDKLKHYPIFYTGEIGKINDYQSLIIPTLDAQKDIIRNMSFLSVYKYGTTCDIFRRSEKEHKKTFKYFDLKLIRESIRPYEVEYIITNELRSRGLLYKLKLNEKMRREIVCFRNEEDKHWYVELVDYIVKKQQFGDQYFVDIFSNPQ